MTKHCIQILGAKVQLHGQLNFLNNEASGSDGGALYAISLGQLHGSGKGIRDDFSKQLWKVWSNMYSLE